MAQKTETGIVRSIIAWIKEQGGDAWHVHGSPQQRAGEPDIDGWIPRTKIVELGYGHPNLHIPHEVTYYVHIKFECKTGNYTPTALQMHRLDVYKKAGYFSEWGTSLDDFKEKLNKYAHR